MTDREHRAGPATGGREPEHRPRRLQITRRGRMVLLALCAVTGLAFAALIAGIGASSPPAGQPVKPVSEATPATPAAKPTPVPRPVLRGPSPLAERTIAEGRLPQTHVDPGGRNDHMTALMRALWSGVVHDSVRPALPAFFPKGAYVQLKAIPSAGSDWKNRLVRDYALDIHAAHGMLGTDASKARFVAVDVPASFSHWVPPGACYNSIGYYEMPNARIVYREAGHERSFGVASMISWRGVWYVVHLGSVLRPGGGGIVDQPEAGRGVSQYSGTC